MISLISFLTLLAGLALTPPMFDEVRAAWQPSDIRVLDRHGAVLHEVRVDARRRRLEWTTVEEMSPALLHAVLAAEDRRFHAHGGVDLRALGAAAWQRARHGTVRGASTITMQVAAMIDPELRRVRGGRTIPQKWRQMRLAWGLEARWSKRRILEAYLNLVGVRGELQGIAAGAAVLFDKSPHGIDAGEAAVLAALLRAPNAMNDQVAQRARRLGGGDARLVEAAVARAGTAAPGTGPRVGMAPHAAARLVRGRSAREGDIASTLDLDVQRIAAGALTRHLSEVRTQHVQDGAVLVVDNATGDVLAYVGSSGALSAAPRVDGVQAPRQAGSTLKPFLYGLALDEQRLTAAALVNDSPLELAVANGLYRPHNYDEQFRGLVSVRTALASSLNVPAVRTLGLVGDEAFATYLRRLGFSLREAGSFYGPALALGSADVTLWDLVGAYRMLANGGRTGPLMLTPSAGRVDDRALSPGAAFVIADILADRESRSATFGLENVLATPFWTAVKTGTSKDMRDNWCVGFSRRYTVGVWVGNFSGESMWNVSGITGAAPIWRDVMMWLHRDTPSVPPTPPPSVRRIPLAGRDGEPLRDEWFLPGTEPVAPVSRAAVAAPTIVTPVRGTRIAIDPDIPPAHQRVAFEARHAPPDTRWVLDGADVGRGAVVLWPPQRGRHTLVLMTHDGHVFDRTQFDVRGAASAD